MSSLSSNRNLFQRGFEMLSRKSHLLLLRQKIHFEHKSSPICDSLTWSILLSPVFFALADCLARGHRTKRIEIIITIRWTSSMAVGTNASHNSTTHFHYQVHSELFTVNFRVLISINGQLFQYCLQMSPIFSVRQLLMLIENLNYYPSWLQSTDRVSFENPVSSMRRKHWKISNYCLKIVL